MAGGELALLASTLDWEGIHRAGIKCTQSCLRNPFYDNLCVLRCILTSALSTVSSRGSFVFNLREDLRETDYKTSQFPGMDLNLVDVLFQQATNLWVLKWVFCLQYFEEFVEWSRILEPSRKMLICSSSFLPHVMSL